MKIAIIDFEATALWADADVIEAGIAIFDRQETIWTWSSLVCPSSDCRWDEKSAGVHNIPRAVLADAPSPRWVAAELNRVVREHGVSLVHADGFPYDPTWMTNLFHDGAITPAFDIAPIEKMPRMHVNAVRHFMNEYLSRTMVPHRAGEDALRLMQAYCYALGKRPTVVPQP
jgi:DNA polymerase III epsilon subunit-like protein